MFRQYYHYRQIEAFGADSMRFVPLGSRGEFPDSPPDQLVPAPKRTYVYSYMAAITDGTRAKVHTLLANDTVIKPASRFIHVSQSWHGSANNEEYVSPERYHEVMQQSAFSICPKGHSVEQFRIYEAIESGSIPVMEKKGDYLSQHLPPEYMESPMLLLDSWDDVVPKMTELWSNPQALRQKQLDLISWFDKYMRDKTRELEDVLIARGKEGSPDLCAPKE